MRGVSLVVGFLLCACAPRQAVRPSGTAAQASASLEPRSGSAASGQAVFTTVGDEVRLEVELINAPPGLHGVHLHERGDCSSPDAESAGDHWNPASQAHGGPGGGTHLGDIGNIRVDAEGHGSLDFSTPRWTVGTRGLDDVVGRALVVHAAADDLATQPSGNSGARIACGVVRSPGAPPPVVSDRFVFRE